MALADYDTSAEKIAALKAATLDPALIQIKTANTHSPYTVTEDIFVFNFAKTLSIKAGALTYDFLDSNSSEEIINEKFESGDILVTSESFMFINDSDITYSDTITTYQDRLATILNTIGTTLLNDTLTPGANGSIILSGGYPKLSDNNYLGWYTIRNPLPIPTGTVLTCPEATKYFDVPADW